MSDSNSTICKEIEEDESEEGPRVAHSCVAQSCLFDNKVIFPCLEELIIRELDELKTIWHSNQIVNQDSFARLRDVTIQNCKSDKHVGKENLRSSGPIFPNLQVLTVEDDGLGYGKHKLKNLESSVISFRNLTTLERGGCRGLKHLITYSVAESLMHLTTMKVESCPRITVIVTTEGDDPAMEINFRELQHLTLSDLPNFQSFCSGSCTVKVPSLTCLSVRYCKKVSISKDNEKLQITKIDLNREEDEREVKGNGGDEIVGQKMINWYSDTEEEEEEESEDMDESESESESEEGEEDDENESE